ncbi:unnamed protein product [Auanema sp. JU1783]|nr:unnamed protein product [Auanema sp. JU1783]
MENSSLPYYPEDSDLVVTVTACAYILYPATVILGIPCNIFVLIRMIRLSKKSKDLYNNGAGLCLFIMAIADIVSLLSITVHYTLSITSETVITSNYLHQVSMNLICKTTLFSMHVATCVSIWSWLLMSTLRYLSVYHPLVYIRLWKLPYKVMMLVICFASIFNLWLLIAVVNDPEGGCTITTIANSTLLSRSFLLLESVASFVIPTITIIYVDASVLLGLRFHFQQKQEIRKNVSQPAHKSNHFLFRWLSFALIDIGLNAPDNIARIAGILGIIQPSNSDGYYIYNCLAKLLYYSQFGFNGVYLALFIYDKSTRPTKIRIIEGGISDRSKDVVMLNEATPSQHETEEKLLQASTTV